MGFAVVASAGAGAGAAVAGAATARPEGLGARVGGAGGASGVVAMTWISGSFVWLEPALGVDASWAATLGKPTASTPQNAQSAPRNTCTLKDTNYSPAACAIAHAGPVE